MKRLAVEFETQGLLDDEQTRWRFWRQLSGKKYFSLIVAILAIFNIFLPSFLSTLRFPSILIFFVWVLAAMGPYLWSTVVFAEISFFTDALPEKRLINDYISVITQLMVCITVPSFILLQSWLKSSTKILAILIMVLGLAASLLTAFFWQSVHEVGGQKRSIGILLCTFLGGPIAALSVVAIWPLAAERGLLMISAVVAGTGLTQVLGVVLGIAQGSGEHTTFSPRTFFLIGAGIQAVSLIVFAIYIFSTRLTEELPLEVTTPTPDVEEEEEPEAVPLLSALSMASYGVAHSAFINLLHGSVQGTMSFRFKGWHNLPSLLHTAMMCALSIGAAVPFITIFLRSYRISIFSVLLTMFWIPLFLFSFLSKSQFHTFVAYVLLALNVCFGCLFSFSDIMILIHTARTVPPHAQRKTTRLVGAARQIGASVASLLTFALVYWYQQKYG